MRAAASSGRQSRCHTGTSCANRSSVSCSPSACLLSQRFPEIDGITIDVPAQNKIVVNGIDKQTVGQFAAQIREKRPPEPYKGKGIRYTGEHIIRKEGKAGKGKK